MFHCNRRALTLLLLAFPFIAAICLGNACTEREKLENKRPTPATKVQCDDDAYLKYIGCNLLEDVSSYKDQDGETGKKVLRSLVNCGIDVKNNTFVAIFQDTEGGQKHFKSDCGGGGVKVILEKESPTGQSVLGIKVSLIQERIYFAAGVGIPVHESGVPRGVSCGAAFSGWVEKTNGLYRITELHRP